MSEMSIHPSKEYDYRKAESNLHRWLKKKDMGIIKCHDWNKWNYNNRPFWSVWGFIYGMGKRDFGTEAGIHIYDDGEITIVTITNEELQGLSI